MRPAHRRSTRRRAASGSSTASASRAARSAQRIASAVLALRLQHGRVPGASRARAQPRRPPARRAPASISRARSAQRSASGYLPSFSSSHECLSSSRASASGSSATSLRALRHTRRRPCGTRRRGSTRRRALPARATSSRVAKVGDLARRLERARVEAGRFDVRVDVRGALAREARVAPRRGELAGDEVVQRQHARDVVRRCPSPRSMCSATTACRRRRSLNGSPSYAVSRSSDWRKRR